MHSAQPMNNAPTINGINKLSSTSNIPMTGMFLFPAIASVTAVSSPTLRREPRDRHITLSFTIVDADIIGIDTSELEIGM